MDIKKATEIIRKKCKVSNTFPIISNCNKECGMYENCVDGLTPNYWNILDNPKTLIMEAAKEIKQHCNNQKNHNSCEDCNFFHNCEERIPAFWDDVVFL